MQKRSGHATLSEVAKRAAVGTTTVSRVINGGQNVDPATKARVEAMIELLGYVPNHAARVLKGTQTRTIGMVVPSIADPFFASCVEATQAVARAHDRVLIVLVSHNQASEEQEALRVLMQHRVEGILLAPANSASVHMRELLRRLPMPIVALDRPVSGSSVPHVVVDNAHGANLATQHLIGHGYRRILCLTGEVGLFTIRERIRGYQEAMQQAGLPPLVDTSTHDHALGEGLFERLFHQQRPPDAIFTLKNTLTIGTLEILKKRGIRIPGDVALLGYDDFALAAIVQPTISVVQQPVEELGRRAAELLFQRLEQPESEAPRAMELKTTLICRASCGCRPAPANARLPPELAGRSNARERTGARRIRSPGPSPFER